MTDPTYYCEWCDKSFKNNNGLSIHTNKSKDHAKRVAALGQMPRDVEEQPPVEPALDSVVNVDLTGGNITARFGDDLPQSVDVTGDIFDNRVADSDISLAEALGDIDLSMIEGDELHAPMEPFDTSERRVLANARPNTKLNAPLRMLKMLRPICTEHNDGSAGWWYGCMEDGHDPYQQIVERTEMERKLGPPDERGRRKVLGVEPSVYYVQSFNITQVQYHAATNGGQTMRKMRGKGFVMPEERGIALYCQFINCWVQEKPGKPLISTDYGDFCRRDQAQMVAAQEQAVFLDVYHDVHRRQQIAALGV